jgi:DNA-binding beta-propeller fold protein YncE
MRFLVIPALLTACAVSGLAQTADRVYTADQTSNTVSVIDPATNKFLGFRQLVESDVKAQPRYLAILPASGTELGAPVQVQVP